MNSEPTTLEPAAPLLSDDELLELYEAGVLANAISQGFGLGNREASVHLEDRCLELHKSGHLDLIAVGEADLTQVTARDFFNLQHFLVRVLPQLSAEPDRIMALVEKLVAQGGDDLASNRPNGAFVEWCRAEPARGRAVIEAAWQGDSRAGAHLTFALQSLGAIAEARRFVLETEDARRLSGITALGRILDSDPQSRAETLHVLQSAIGNEAADNLAAHVVQTTAAIMEQGEGDDPLTLETLRRAVARPGADVRNRAAHVIWAYPGGVLNEATLGVLLPMLEHVNPEHRGTIQEFDMAFAELIRQGFAGRVIETLGKLIVGARGALELDAFSSTTDAITTAQAPVLSRTVCDWLMTGDASLCRGLSQALSRHDQDEATLRLEAADLPQDPARLLFLCRKLVGWFFLQPGLMASGLVSVLDACSDKVAADVEELLSDLVLRNYGGVRDGLEAITQTQPAYARVRRALAVNDEYLDGLKAVGEIKELQPPESHRRTAHLHQSDLMRKAKTEAEAQSAFLSLVRRSTVLHGRRTLTFLRGLSGETRPMEMQLASHGVSFEMPRMEMVDPVGLQIILLKLRGERPPQ